MASPFLRQEDLKVLDQTRQRLFQLASNLSSLKTDVEQGAPLPPWFVAQLPFFIADRRSTFRLICSIFAVVLLIL